MMKNVIQIETSCQKPIIIGDVMIFDASALTDKQKSAVFGMLSLFSELNEEGE